MHEPFLRYGAARGAPAHQLSHGPPARTTPSSGPRTARWPPGRGCSCGSVTAETAVLLPVLLVVLAAALGVLVCVAAQLRCVDAARGAARAAARGEDLVAVQTVGARLAPPGARVIVIPRADAVEVVVSARVQPLGRVLRLLPAVEVTGRALAAVEGQP